MGTFSFSSLFHVSGCCIVLPCSTHLVLTKKVSENPIPSNVCVGGATSGGLQSSSHCGFQMRTGLLVVVRMPRADSVSNSYAIMLCECWSSAIPFRVGYMSCVLH